MSGFGAAGGIRTHNPWVRGLIVLVSSYIARYVFRTSRPAHLRLFVSVVLTGVVTWQDVC